MRGPGSVVCPECGRLVELGESSCPNCGRWQPSLFGLSPILQRTFGTLEVTQLIFWACCILYALSLVLDPGAVLSGGGGLFGILSPSGSALAQLGMTGGALVDRFGLWWTPISATYLHGSLLHIFFNMLWLRMLGPQLEADLGPGRFFLLYTAAGAGGFVISNMFSGNPTVGASGAIFGLLAATIILARHHGGAWGEAVGQQAIMYAVLLFAFGFVSSRTNNWAHAGGFVVGGLAMFVLLKQSERAEGPLVQIGALLLALGTIASVAASFVVVRF